MQQHKVVIFGDSLTTGENNCDRGIGCIYKEMHPEYQVSYHAVSGICIGNYSIYPVTDTALSLIQKYEKDVEDADEIILEFGCNDTTALMLNYTTPRAIQIDLIKCRDQITQINPHAKVVFLLMKPEEDDLSLYSRFHCRYLNEMYFNKTNILCKSEDWKNAYKTIFDIVSSSMKIHAISGFNILNKYLDVDSVHPTEKGYVKIVSALE